MLLNYLDITAINVIAQFLGLPGGIEDGLALSHLDVLSVVGQVMPALATGLAHEGELGSQHALAAVQVFLEVKLVGPGLATLCAVKGWLGEAGTFKMEIRGTGCRADVKYLSESA